jgi:hypothetical protein
VGEHENDEHRTEEPESPEIGAGDYVAPVLNRKAFHCPHCNVYAPQLWQHCLVEEPQDLPGGFTGTVQQGTNAHQGHCFNCQKPTYWLSFLHGTAVFTGEDVTAIMVWPVGSANAPYPHPDFPEDPKADYEEARGIVDRSPRGATALLRLSLQKLCQALGQSGKNINDDIAALVQNGLPPGIQEALDSLRVIGNNAVHPGQLDLRDEPATAVALFGLLNFIVEQMITRPRELANIYAKLPPSAVAAIQKRDGGASSTP